MCFTRVLKAVEARRGDSLLINEVICLFMCFYLGGFGFRFLRVGREPLE